MEILEEERDKGTEEIFEVIIAENFPILMMGIKAQIQEAQRMPSRKIPKNLHLGMSY